VTDLLPIDQGDSRGARAELLPAPVTGRARLDARTAAEAEATHWRRLGLETPEERKARLAHLINPPAEDWARLEALHVKAPAGEVAEYVHIKCDADPDAVTRPFPYLRKGISSRRGGQS